MNTTIIHFEVSSLTQLSPNLRSYNDWFTWVVYNINMIGANWLLGASNPHIMLRDIWQINFKTCSWNNKDPSLIHNSSGNLFHENRHNSPNWDANECWQSVIRNSSLNSNEQGNCCHIYNKGNKHMRNIIQY